MKYVRGYKKLAKRISESVELEEAQKDVEEVYGKKAANKLISADPLLLHDLMVISHLSDGKSKKRSPGITRFLHRKKTGKMI